MADLVRVFLDANLLARPVTRTLLIAGGPAAGFRAGFSRTALAEADRHLKDGMTPVSDLVTRFGWEVGPDGHDPERFAATDAKDRQLLADAQAGAAVFLVTDDVDDYGVADLTATGISAVTADVFLAERMAAPAYLEALEILGAGRSRPPRKPAELHQALGRQHPLLVTRFAGEFDVVPDEPTHPEPGEVFRGPRCLRCIRTTRPVSDRGLCTDCAA